MRGLGAHGAALLAALALAGCATLSEQECRAADWDAIGRADGANGEPAGRFDGHRKACARHGVEPQEAAWRAGYAKGLEGFCTPSGGYVAGRDGRAHRQACAGQPHEEKFLQAHRHGQEVNALRRKVTAMRQNLRDVEMKLLGGDYNDSEAAQIRSGMTELEASLRIREWELQRFDEDYAKEYGAPPLAAPDRR
jgi:hypothetical protein